MPQLSKRKGRKQQKKKRESWWGERERGERDRQTDRERERERERETREREREKEERERERERKRREREKKRNERERERERERRRQDWPAITYIWMGRRAHAVHCTWRVAQNVQTSLLVHGKKIRPRLFTICQARSQGGFGGCGRTPLFSDQKKRSVCAFGSCVFMCDRACMHRRHQACGSVAV